MLSRQEREREKKIEDWSTEYSSSQSLNFVRRMNICFSTQLISLLAKKEKIVDLYRVNEIVT